MGLKTFDKEFVDCDNNKIIVVVTTFPATEAIDISNKLISNVVSLMSIADNLDGNHIDIITNIFKNNFNSPDIIKLILQLLQYSKINSIEIKDTKILNVTFSSNDLSLLFNILKWIIEVNFKDFLELLKIAIAKGVEKAKVLK
jgi:hypothetical protein